MNHSLNAEQSVLGALLQDPKAWERLEGAIELEDFYRHDHRMIFREASRLFDQNKPVDVLTVFDALASSGDLVAAGGIEYLNAIIQSVPSSANVRQYADILRNLRTKREVQALGQEIMNLAAESSDSENLVERATTLAMALGSSRYSGVDPKPVGDVLKAVLGNLERRVDAGNAISGLPTGFVDLDEALCGLQSGDLVIVAGRPSMGKTTLAVNIAENVAGNDGVALVVSLEMSAEQLVERSIARSGAINTQSLRTGKFNENDWPRLTHAMQMLQDQKLIVADDPSLSSVSRIRLAARKQVKKYGKLDLLVIDYLQLMVGDGNNRNEELGGITRALKLLAREISCPIMLLSQLSRKVEERQDKRPMMSDLRESGAIEQDADVILMAYRDDYYHPESPMKGFAEILIRKQRMGPLGEVHLTFQGQYSRFLDADKERVMQARNTQVSKPRVRYSLQD